MRQAHDPRRPRDRRVPLKTGQAPDVFAGQRPTLSAIVPAAVHAEHPLQKHRQKNYIHANERRPKMHFPPELVHDAASRFRVPIVNAGEQSEDRPWSDDVVEMRDDVISVVQIEIGGIERERNPGQSANPEHRKKRCCPQHRDRESDRAAPK